MGVRAMTAPSPRQRLDEWGRALPCLWRLTDAARARRRPDSADWPSPVYLPLEAAGEATLTAIRARGDTVRGPAELSPAAVTTQCLAAWRMTQGIYRVDPTLYAALIDTPVTGDIPADVLLYLPEWCIYIETPRMTVPVQAGDPLPVLGLWYWLDAAPGRGMILCIGIDTGRRPPLTVQHVPLVGTIDEAIDATLREWAEAVARGNAARQPPPGYADAVRAWLPPALSLVLYICSQAAEVAGRGRPGNPQPVKTRRAGEQLFAASAPRTWDVGVRLGSALRAAMASTAGGDGSPVARAGVRPHIRRAHWHTYLLGPRTEDRRRQLRWMPPIAVALDGDDSIVPTIHPIRGQP